MITMKSKYTIAAEGCIITVISLSYTRNRLVLIQNCRAVQHSRDVIYGLYTRRATYPQSNISIRAKCHQSSNSQIFVICHEITQQVRMQVLSNMTLLFQARCGLVLVLLSIVQCIVQQLQEKTYVNMQRVDCIRTRQLSSTEKDKAIFVFDVSGNATTLTSPEQSILNLWHTSICLQKANDWQTL